MSTVEPKRVLILGGGFAGLIVAMELENKLAPDPAVEVTLVNRDKSSCSPPCSIRSRPAI